MPHNFILLPGSVILYMGAPRGLWPIVQPFPSTTLCYACTHAQRIVDSLRGNVPRKNRATGSTLTLFDRLHDLYVDCLQSSSDKNSDKARTHTPHTTHLSHTTHITHTPHTHPHMTHQRFRGAVNLLAQLERNHTRPSLVVNLYEDEKGYSLVLCSVEGVSVVPPTQ